MNRLTLSAFVLLALTPVVRADSSPDQNKAVVRRIYQEVFNEGKIEQLDKYVAVDSVDHQVMPGKTAPLTCRESIKEFLGVFRKAFPDLNVRIDDMIAEGDKVVARYTVTGTHKGEFLGMPPTGKAFSIQVIDILRFNNGKCVEHWGVADDAGMMHQLGAPAAK